jgi:hypothetical protein
MKLAMKLLATLFLAGCGPKDVPAPAPSETAVTQKSEPAAEQADEKSPEPEEDKAALLEAEKIAYEQARPVFEKYCAKCHSKDGKKATASKLKHFSMDAYPFGGHHAAEIGEEIREVLGATGKKPTMPMDKPGAIRGQELELILAWSKAFDAAHAAGLHQHHGEHSHGHHESP